MRREADVIIRHTFMLVIGRGLEQELPLSSNHHPYGNHNHTLHTLIRWIAQVLTCTLDRLRLERL